MNKIKKKLVVILCVLSAMLILEPINLVSASMDEDYDVETSEDGISFKVYPQDIKLPFDNFEEEYIPTVQNRTTYITVYGYKYTKGKIKYASWRNGASAGSKVAKVTLNFNRSFNKQYNINFTTSVSGGYSNKASIQNTLGVTLGKSKGYSLGAGISVTVPKKKRYLIKYRPAYYKYKVVETKYKEGYIPGYGMHRVKLGTKTCYVNVFSHWDFTVVKA